MSDCRKCARLISYKVKPKPCNENIIVRCAIAGRCPMSIEEVKGLDCASFVEDPEAVVL